jgi:DNA replication protein DnaC
VRPSLQRALIQALDRKVWPVFMHGPAGVGKSCAVAALYVRWPAGDYGPGPWWIEAATLLPTYARARADNEALKIRNSLRDSNLVILDDVAVRELTPAQADCFLELLKLRAGKPLIVTCNLAPDELTGVLDNRIASRLCEETVIGIAGQDRRLEKTLVLEA